MDSLNARGLLNSRRHEINADSFGVLALVQEFNQVRKLLACE
jgi:hypothetical protein